MEEMRVYIANLGKYNEGELVGAWFTPPVDFEEVKERMHKKWHEAKYIPYFQAHTNTYAPASVLRERFEPVLKQDNVVGISIATRADCLEDDVLDYLSE